MSIQAAAPDDILPRVPVGEWAESAVDWLDVTFGAVFDVVADILRLTDAWLVERLLSPAALVLAGIFAVIGLLLRSWQFGLATMAGMTLIIAMDRWESAMLTLAFITIATGVALLISIPVGILAARHRAVSVVMRPVLDFMQTMPAFVYLVPAVTLFSLGLVPGIIATIIFALPPGVRLTELGIRQVDSETVEAGQAFGATPLQILRGIQVPLAMPTILAGINQVIMLALSMSVIAGIVGTNGLGKDVVEAITRLQVGQGVEAGLAVVILAIYLDRLTSSGQSGGGTRAFLRKTMRKPIIGGGIAAPGSREPIPATGENAAENARNDSTSTTR